MGVMTCSREDCDNIMCNTYIDNIGYICSECQKEFQENMDQGEMEERDIISNLKAFMNTSKKDGSRDAMTVNEFFNKHNR